MVSQLRSIGFRPRGGPVARAVPRIPDTPVSARVAALVTTKSLRAKETAFYEGDAAAYLFEVKEGVLKLYKLMSDGRRQITGLAYPGHLVGISPCSRYPYTAEAITAVTLARYPRARLEELYDEAPDMVRRLLSATANELALAQDQMLLLGRKSAAEKIASFLLRLSRWNEECGDDPSNLYLPMSRTDIADYLGLTIETTCRILTQLGRSGMIEIERPSRIRLRDPDRLQDLAEGEADALAA